MRWIKENPGAPFLARSFREKWGLHSVGQAPRARTLGLGLSGILISALLLSGAAPEKHFPVYSVAATYSLTLVPRDGRDYVGLLEVLEPLGKVTAKSEDGRWRLRYNGVQGDFQVD